MEGGWSFLHHLRAASYQCASETRGAFPHLAFFFAPCLFSFLSFPLLSLFFSSVGEQMHGTANEGKGLAWNSCHEALEHLCRDSEWGITSPHFTGLQGKCLHPTQSPPLSSVLERPRHFSLAVHQACFTQPGELSSAVPVAKK